MTHPPVRTRSGRRGDAAPPARGGSAKKGLRVAFALAALTALALVAGCAPKTGPSAPAEGPRGGGGLDGVIPMPLAGQEVSEHESRLLSRGDLAAIAQLDATVLRVYPPELGIATTQTPSGFREAIVVRNRVASLGGNDSPIPADGYVIAAAPPAARWLEDHLAPGVHLSVGEAKVEVPPTLENERALADAALASSRAALAQAEGDAAVESAQRAEVAAQLHQAGVEIQLAGAAAARGAEQQARAGIALVRARAELARSMATASEARETRAVWLRLEAHQPRDVEATLARLADAGFNTVFLETIYDGRSIYPTRNPMMPQQQAFRGWDPLMAALESADKHGLELHAWVHVFDIGRPEDTPIAQEHPGWLAMTRESSFVSPLERGRLLISPSSDEAKAHLLESLRYLAQLYGVDGIHLDDLRFGRGLPGGRGFDYSNAAREEFHALTGRDPASFDHEADPKAMAQWQQYREDEVTEFLENIREEMRRIKPELKLSVRVAPGLEESRRSYAQDWGLWAEGGLVDFVATQFVTTYQAALGVELEAVRAALPEGFPLLAGLSPYLRFTPRQLVDLIGTTRVGGAAGVAIMSAADLDARALQNLQRGPFRAKARAPWAPAAKKRLNK